MLKGLFGRGKDRCPSVWKERIISGNLVGLGQCWIGTACEAIP